MNSKRRVAICALCCTCLFACSGSSSSSPGVSAKKNNYAGLWSITTIYTSSTCGSSNRTKLVQILQSGEAVTVADLSIPPAKGGPLKGTVSDRTLTIGRGRFSITATMNPDHTGFTGTGTYFEKYFTRECKETFTIDAVRAPVTNHNLEISDYFPLWGNASFAYQDGSTCQVDVQNSSSPRIKVWLVDKSVATPSWIWGLSMTRLQNSGVLTIVSQYRYRAGGATDTELFTTPIQLLPARFGPGTYGGATALVGLNHGNTNVLEPDYTGTTTFTVSVVRLGAVTSVFGSLDDVIAVVIVEDYNTITTAIPPVSDSGQRVHVFYLARGVGPVGIGTDATSGAKVSPVISANVFYKSF